MMDLLPFLAVGLAAGRATVKARRGHGVGLAGGVAVDAVGALP